MAGEIQNGTTGEDAQADRRRLIDAFTKIASERGYASTTVNEVAAAADLPRSVFFEHFSSKRQCLSAAYDTFFERLVAETKQNMDTDGEWPLQVKAAVGAGLGFVSETATRSRFFAVDALVAGPVILERYLAAMNRVVPLLREGREHSPEAGELPELTEPVLIGGIAGLLSGSLLEEDLTSIAGLESELVEMLLTPYVGRDEARRLAAA